MIRNISLNYQTAFQNKDSPKKSRNQKPTMWTRIMFQGVVINRVGGSVCLLTVGAISEI